MKKKYYAVRVGWRPGVYKTWQECEKQVNGYKKSSFRSFYTYEEAFEWLEDGW